MRSAALGRSVWRETGQRDESRWKGCRRLIGREGCPEQRHASWESPSAWVARCHLALSAAFLWVSIFSKFDARKCTLVINTVSASSNDQEREARDKV